MGKVFFLIMALVFLGTSLCLIFDGMDDKYYKGTTTMSLNKATEIIGEYQGEKRSEFEAIRNIDGSVTLVYEFAADRVFTELILDNDRGFGEMTDSMVGGIMLLIVSVAAFVWFGIIIATDL